MWRASKRDGRYNLFEKSNGQEKKKHKHTSDANATECKNSSNESKFCINYSNLFSILFVFGFFSHVRGLLVELQRQPNFFLGRESFQGLELPVQGFDLLSHPLAVLLEDQKAKKTGVSRSRTSLGLSSKARVYTPIQARVPELRYYKLWTTVSHK